MCSMSVIQALFVCAIAGSRFTGCESEAELVACIYYTTWGGLNNIFACDVTYRLTCVIAEAPSVAQIRKVSTLVLQFLQLLLYSTLWLQAL